MLDASLGNFGKEQYNNNISNLNKTELDSYQMYLNDKKELCVKYKRLNIAGGEYSNMLINLDKNEYVSR